MKIAHIDDKGWLDTSGKNVVRVSVVAPLADGYYADGSRILRAAGGKDVVVADLAGIGSLRGVHNAQNAACAVATCAALGIDAATIQKGLKGFPGLAHRMEQVGRKGKILFVNDSKATNADSAAHTGNAHHQSFICHPLSPSLSCDGTKTSQSRLATISNNTGR